MTNSQIISAAAGGVVCCREPNLVIVAGDSVCNKRASASFDPLPRKRGQAGETFLAQLNPTTFPNS